VATSEVKIEWHLYPGHGVLIYYYHLMAITQDNLWGMVDMGTG